MTSTMLVIFSPYGTPSSPLNATTPGDLLSVALSPAQDVKTQVDALGVILPSVSPNAKTPDDKLGPPLNFKAQNVTSTSVTIISQIRVISFFISRHMVDTTPGASVKHFTIFTQTTAWISIR